MVAGLLHRDQRSMGLEILASANALGDLGSSVFVRCSRATQSVRVSFTAQVAPPDVEAIGSLDAIATPWRERLTDLLLHRPSIELWGATSPAAPASTLPVEGLSLILEPNSKGFLKVIFTAPAIGCMCAPTAAASSGRSVGMGLSQQANRVSLASRNQST